MIIEFRVRLVRFKSSALCARFSSIEVDVEVSKDELDEGVPALEGFAPISPRSVFLASTWVPEMNTENPMASCAP